MRNTLLHPILSSLSIEVEQLVASIEIGGAHPNKMNFKGVLVRLDEPSTKPPNGSNGHRILVPTDVAQKRLGTLVGMGLNYRASLDGHAQQNKVGVIQKAWIEGKNLCVSGHVWKHDFPQAEKDLKQEGLGMSMEIGQVQVDDQEAEIWKLNDFQFLGATILWRDAAAYRKTLAIAAKARDRRGEVKKPATKQKVKAAAAGSVMTTEQVAAIASKAAAEATSKLMTGLLGRQTDILAELSGKVTELELNAHGATEEEEDEEEATGITVPTMTTKPRVQANKEEDEDEEEDEEEAAGVVAHKEPDGDECDDDDDEDMESVAKSAGVETGDLDDMGPDLADEDKDDGPPGHLSKGAKNKGNKTSSEDAHGPNVSKGVTGAQMKAMVSHIKKLNRKMAAYATENKRLQKQVNQLQTQSIRAAKEDNRRSVPVELTGLLVKAGLDPNEMRASGVKVTAAEFDSVLAQAGQLDPVTRVTLKNLMYKNGLMEDGVVVRNRQ